MSRRTASVNSFSSVLSTKRYVTVLRVAAPAKITKKTTIFEMVRILVSFRSAFPWRFCEGSEASESRVLDSSFELDDWSDDTELAIDSMVLTLMYWYQMYTVRKMSCDFDLQKKCLWTKNFGTVSSRYDDLWPRKNVLQKHLRWPKQLRSWWNLGLFSIAEGRNKRKGTKIQPRHIFDKSISVTLSYREMTFDKTSSKILMSKREPPKWKTLPFFIIKKQKTISVMYIIYLKMLVQYYVHTTRYCTHK